MKTDTWYGKIPDDWEIFTVEDLVKNNILFSPKDGNHGSIHPKGEDFVENGIPFVMASDLMNGEVDYKNCKKITKKQAQSLQKGFAINGDILLSHKATIGRTAIVKTDLEYILLTPQVTYYRVKNSEKLSQLYLYCFFNSPRYQEILKILAGGGTTRDYIGITAQGKIPILLPPKEEQNFIEGIYWCLDRKIENLRKQNETLEAIAQTLFKHWFVDFDFPNEDGKPYKSSGGAMVRSKLGKIPADWCVGKLGDFINHQKGLSYKGEGLADSGTGIPMHNLKSIYEGGGYQHEGIKFYKGEYKDRHLCTAGDIIVCNTEQGEKHRLIAFPARIPRYFHGISIYTHHISKLTPRNPSEFAREFIYYLIYSREVRHQIVSFTNGTTVNMLPADGLEEPLFVVPTTQLIATFSEVIQPIWAKAECNYEQIQALTKTRDLLLPKLMSGELRITE